MKIWLVILILFCAPAAFAQVKGKKTDPVLPKQKTAVEQFEGKIIAKPWSKTGESYCAQGSGYFVIELTSGGDYIIEGDARMLERNLNKLVIVKGSLEKKVIKYNDNEQHPIGHEGEDKNEYYCTVLKVKSIMKK